MASNLRGTVSGRLDWILLLLVVNTMLHVASGLWRSSGRTAPVVLRRGLRAMRQLNVDTQPRNPRDDTSPEFRDTDEFVVASLYRFHRLDDDRVARIVDEAKHIISTTCPVIKGTLYVANEGVNGQFCLPVAWKDTFPHLLREVDDELFAPVELNFGLPFTAGHYKARSFPFKKLLIKRRKEVLTDGIDESLDWDDAGPELAPADWHAELVAKRHSDQNQNNDAPILLDCRNEMESMKGTFVGAVPLNTVKFSDTWATLDAVLRDVPPTRRILTFCTGGIRCVKVNAYLKQKLGYENIGRLQQGIIAYDRWIAETRPAALDANAAAVTNAANANANAKTNEANDTTEPRESLFVGQNYLFDRRYLAERFTTDES